MSVSLHFKQSRFYKAKKLNVINPMTKNNPDNVEDTIEQRFESLYPNYDYSLESSHNEKDTRKRKRMKNMY
ncbi:MAG: hypothetical protein ACW9XH_03865 [Candidatus Nitrosopumilus sp. bin_32a]